MRFLLSIIFCFLSLLLFAQDNPIPIPVLKIRDLEKEKQYLLQPYSKIYIDYSTKKNIQDILQKSTQQKFIPFGKQPLDYMANSYWVQSQLENLNTDSLTIALYFMGVEHIDFYILPTHQLDSLTDTQILPVMRRSYKKYRDLTYLTIPPKQCTLLFHIVTEQKVYKQFTKESLTSFSFYHGDYQTFWTKYKAKNHAFSLLFLGALGMMFFYNLILFFILWDRNYLYYILYLLFFGIRVFVERDFYADWIAPTPPKYALIYSLLTPLLFMFFQLLFTLNFLEVKRFLSWAHRFIRVLLLVITLNLGITLLGHFSNFFFLYELTLIISYLTMFVVAVVISYKQRKATSYFYLLGITFLVVSTIIYIRIPATEYTIFNFNLPHIGVLLEMGLFSLGLANKINEARKALVEQKLIQAHEREILIEEKNKELEVKVAQRTAELQESNATKDKLFSIISHDLRSPLNTLKGMLSALEVNILNEKEVKAIISDIRRRLDSTDTTLNDLLQWAISQMEGTGIHQEQILLKDAVSNSITLFETVAQSKQITLSTDIPSTIQVYADLNHLKVILRNLIANALKFTNAHGTITISAKAERKGLVLISVKDTGIGMTDQQVKQLFEKNTLHTTRGTQNEKGTGLGLLLCKDFVEKNGGQIWAESQDSKGSIFYFTLLSHSS
jgi:two-component system, sensor histidine kinase LadS